MDDGALQTARAPPATATLEGEAIPGRPTSQTRRVRLARTASGPWWPSRLLPISDRLVAGGAWSVSTRAVFGDLEGARAAHSC